MIIFEKENGIFYLNTKNTTYAMDFDMLYGHRNDPKGYGKALEDFDKIDLLIKQAKRFTPAKFKSNKRYFLRQLEKEINILG